MYSLIKYTSCFSDGLLDELPDCLYSDGIASHILQRCNAVSEVLLRRI